jgi:hypothetical protein
MTSISPLSLVQNGKGRDVAPSVEQLQDASRAHFEALMALAEQQAATESVTFAEFEHRLREALYALARVVVVLFLTLREPHVMGRYPQGRFAWMGRTYRRAPAIGRNVATLFGVVRYWRTYMREVSTTSRRGFHPLDMSLELGADRFSWNVLGTAVRLATKLSFAEARATMDQFVPNTPSTEVIENAVLGFGHHTEAWFKQLPPVEGDGDVLIIQVDGKGAPTATKQELRRRRGKRRRKSGSVSPRHRGRSRRRRYPSKPRRKKGDKSKNAKMATMVVMYTLQSCGTRRKEGPLNVRYYASFAPKRHAFEVARRMADQRGFTADSGRVVQVVIDGDNDLRRLAQEFFPKAEITIDYYHVVERLWTAGECFLKEGSSDLREWVKKQKKRLFRDQATLIVEELRKRLDAVPMTGPGNKGRRKRLEEALGYIERRLAHIRYGSLRRRDLEIGSGAVEGAVKHIIGRRCDHGGMRWIPERAEAVVQLRCIEVAGQWNEFEAFVRERLACEARLNCTPPRIQTNQPRPLPNIAA